MHSCVSLSLIESDSCSGHFVNMSKVALYIAIQLHKSFRSLCRVPREALRKELGCEARR